MKWEYLEVTRQLVPGGKYKCFANGGEIGEYDRISYELMNELGEQGWELVGLTLYLFEETGGSNSHIVKRLKGA